MSIKSQIPYIKEGFLLIFNGCIILYKVLHNCIKIFYCTKIKKINLEDISVYSIDFILDRDSNYSGEVETEIASTDSSTEIKIEDSFVEISLDSSETLEGESDVVEALNENKPSSPILDKIRNRISGGENT